MGHLFIRQLPVCLVHDLARPVADGGDALDWIAEDGRRSASQWELVSRVKPPTSSSPIATMVAQAMRGTILDGVELERLHGLIKGDVQGVGFRFFIMRRAHALGLSGWVRNRDDGTVEFVAEGSRPELEQLERAAREGPRMARVTSVEANWSLATGGLEPFAEL